MQLINGLTSNIKKHAELIGAGAGVLAWGGGGTLVESISNVLKGQVHAPSFDAFGLMFQGISGQLLAVSIAGYFAGEFLGEPALKKGAQGLATANLIQHWLYWSTHSTKEQYFAMSGSIGKNFQNAPTTQQLNPYQY